ncbi:MAG: Fe(2+) transporter permease subunit FeoB [Gammaproteobacteria bacterium]|nr:Fe(2+) transporter permease subunit FeoB [Gammaproteobacteria bacterium]MBU1656409.1 Fe(2+) transporter permease subunit FeoB [Gammaproteobacteria bacterium]MBU1960957.1 Fe(2+) transporter permease subunit FeoB [Gammaproteobacteria bacterium]
MSTKYIIGVVGNPNCGKTTLFNALTGAKQQVGNWPGVTVERKTGRYRLQETEFELVDLPGTYSLDVSEENVSLDERIARDYVAEREADLILNILDASNLERNLYLTAQLLEMKVPLLLALNMMDVARERGIEIDIDNLARRLGCPVIPICAASGEGIAALREGIHKAARDRAIPESTVPYAAPAETAISRLLPMISDPARAHKADPRWLAVRLLEGDSLAQRLAGEAMVEPLSALRAETELALGDDIDISLADARYGFVSQVIGGTVRKLGQVRRSTSDRIDRVVLNRFLGIPLFLLMMYLMFMFTINIGGSFIDFFDKFTGALLVDGLGQFMTSLGLPEWLNLLLAKGIGGGIQVVATFIPVIAFLFLFLSVLEDSGYMARAAFVMDRALRAIGLPGKAFVPLIVGFGCNVPAIMATRTLEQQRDRIMTIVMAPFMSCGARLPVYALFAAAFFPIGGQNIVFGLYLIGIAVAVLTGLIMKQTLLQGQTAPFVMELPPYHAPTLKGVLLRTWDRTQSFVFRAGKIIVPMVLVLNLLNAIGTDGSYGNEDTDKSVLSAIGRTITPAFSPMGMTEENWPAAVGIFTGVLAKEAVVGTLDALYGELAKSDAAAAGAAPEEEAGFDLKTRLMEAFATIPANLGDAMGTWGDPLGLDVGDLSSLETAAEEQGVATGTFGAMAARFDGAAGAFAYLLLILLYFPCTAALAAVYRETNWGWTLFVAGWTSGLAYIAATVYYQVAIFSRQPGTSLAWIAAMLAIFGAVIFALRHWGRLTMTALPQVEPQQA